MQLVKKGKIWLIARLCNTQLALERRQPHKLCKLPSD